MILPHLIHHPAFLIQNVRLIDPTGGRDEITDVAIVDGRIARSSPSNTHVIDATGLIACPGLMDIHVHLREPGQTHKETIETGTAAAAAGGFTFVACMPNTKPPLDNPETVRFVLDQARRVGHCEVGPVACITRSRAGHELTDFADLLEAGAVAFSDDGDGVEDDAVMRSAFERAQEHDALLIQHCEYRSISARGVMHLGEVSRRIGLPGLDPRSEEAMIERDIDLCRQTGGRYHVAHISTANAVAMVRRAKSQGLPVTAEVCTHHLVLTDEACSTADPNTKMHPPLRTKIDIEACREGLLDGTIDCIVTDHAPHTVDEKAQGFLKAPAGIIGLETALGIASLALGGAHQAEWRQIVDWFTVGPSRVLNRTAPSIQEGAPANITMFNPNGPWQVEKNRLASKGENSPFLGWKLPVQPVATVLGTIIRANPYAEIT
jgi:dihydroorotase